jgi:competence protein ComEA
VKNWPHQRLSLSWSRSDCLALTVLAAIFCVLLTITSAGRVRLGEPPRVELSKVRLVDERIDPNLASAASLRRLPLVGPERAAAIVAYRESAERSGRRAFESLEDLQNVPGVGPGIVERMANHVILSWRGRGATQSGSGDS